MADYPVYALNDRVVLTYQKFDLVTHEFLGHTDEFGTVFRVWTNGYNISIRTDSGKVFVRHVSSKGVVKQR